MLQKAFWKSMSNSDLYSALRYLALGANVDWKNHERNSTTALHQAILCNDDVVVEFLLQWFCDIDAIDYDGWSGLHHAAATNNARLLLTLMKRHANVGLKDKNGKVMNYPGAKRKDVTFRALLHYTESIFFILRFLWT